VHCTGGLFCLVDNLDPKGFTAQRTERISDDDGAQLRWRRLQRDRGRAFRKRKGRSDFPSGPCL